MNQTKAWLISTFISRRYSSKDHNIEEMAYEDIEDSSGWNGYILLILSIGMSYYKGGYNAQALMCN